MPNKFLYGGDDFVGLNTAVFFDFENFAFGCNISGFTKKYKEQFIDKILTETDGGGFAIVKAYADWSMPRFRPFSSFLLEHGIEAVQVFGYSFNQDSKNIADFMMSLDILETALSKPYIENFVIVTGDAGFSVILNRLKALGKKTILYKPNKNCSHYLESLADVSLCMGLEAEAKTNAPKSNAQIAFSRLITQDDLPQEDKLGVRLLQPEFLKNFENNGIKVCDSDSSYEDITEIVFGILQVLSSLNLYGSSPQIIISVSRLAALMNYYAKTFDYRNCGYKSMTNFLSDMLRGTDYALMRRNKESFYYVVMSESGVKKLYPETDEKNEKDQTAEKTVTVKVAENSDGKIAGKAAENAIDKAVDKPLGKTVAANGKVLDKAAEQNINTNTNTNTNLNFNINININVPKSNKTIIIDKPFSTGLLPDSDKQNAKIMQAEVLKSFEAFGLTTYPEVRRKDELDKIILGMLKILTYMNLYPQHPQIVASISLLALLLGHYITGFGSKKYGYASLSKLICSCIAGQQYTLERKNNNSRYYIIVSADGLKEIHKDVTVNSIKNIKMNGYIRASVTLMREKNYLSLNELGKLTDKGFCDKTFGIAHPLLKEVGTQSFSDEERTIDNKIVYWKRVFKVDGKLFIVYSDWKSLAAQSAFVDWVKGYIGE